MPINDAFLTSFVSISEVAHIDAIQIEYSAWYTEPERNGLVSTAKELGVAVVAFSPLGCGVLVGTFTSITDLRPQDLRRTFPRLNEENLPQNLRLIEEMKKFAEKKGTTVARLSLAWLIHQGIIPIFGTRNFGRMDENFGAREVDLSEQDLQELRDIIDANVPKGARYVYFRLLGLIVVYSL